MLQKLNKPFTYYSFTSFVLALLLFTKQSKCDTNIDNNRYHHGNEELVGHPDKLVTHTDSEGHIAIILPSKGQYEQVKADLMASEDFENLSA